MGRPGAKCRDDNALRSLLQNNIAGETGRCLALNKPGQQNLPSVIFNWTCFDPPSSPAAIRPNHQPAMPAMESINAVKKVRQSSPRFTPPMYQTCGMPSFWRLP